MQLICAGICFIKQISLLVKSHEMKEADAYKRKFKNWISIIGLVIQVNNNRCLIDGHLPNRHIFCQRCKDSYFNRKISFAEDFLFSFAFGLFINLNVF